MQAERGTPWWFIAWTIFCAVIGLGMLAGMIYLGYLAVQWLQANT